MKLCTRCGFEKDGVLCSEACARPPLALFMVEVHEKKERTSYLTDEELHEVTVKLTEFRSGLEGWVRENTPPEFTSKVEE